MEKLLEHLSWLARIKLCDYERKLLINDIAKIIEFFNKLSGIDVKDVEPTTHVIELVSVFREDKPKKPLSPDKALKNAPFREERFFKAPRIL